MKICIKMVGGLGNQLFQYAFGKVLSLENNIDVVFDLSYYTNYLERRGELKAGVNHGLEIQHLNVNLNEESKISAYNKFKRLSFFYLSTHLPGLYEKIIPKYLNRFQSREYFYPEWGKSLPDINQLLLKRDIYFYGYWQTEKYCKKYRTEILNDFKVIEPQNEVNKGWGEKIVNCESVSLHIRRTDYVSIGWFLGLNYYKKAVDYISQVVENPVFFVFSDDVEWTKENLKLPFETHYMNHNSIGHAHEDLRLMSMCKHNIIANSTFSWWGAWLNNNKGKIVVAPKVWFPNMSLDKQPEIQADGWILIDG